MFEELKNGLQKPLQGMGLSFSSSLFGLAGSLILGFLDLKASQAQNRFYHNLEDWLSTITDVQAGEGNGTMSQSTLLENVPVLQKSIERLGVNLDHSRGAGPGVSPLNGNSGTATEELADAVANLVQQMREEQKMVRQWIQSQQVQQSEIQRMLIRNAGK